MSPPPCRVTDGPVGKSVAHKRIMLKLSGEALCGSAGGFGVDPATMARVNALALVGDAAARAAGRARASRSCSCATSSGTNSLRSRVNSLTRLALAA